MRNRNVKTTQAFLNSLYKKPMTSIWETEDLKQSQYNPDSPFLNKAIAPGQSMELTFVSYAKRERPADTKFGNPGDAYFTFYFTDGQGKERSIDQNATVEGRAKGAFYNAICKNERTGFPGIEIGERFRVSREGEGKDTRYVATKLSGDAANPLMEKADSPF